MGEPETAAVRTGPVLAIFAHPDDAEICAGGTLAAWAAAGREVHLLVLTNGDRGSSDPDLSRAQLASIRLAETEAGGEVLGLAGVRVLSTHDGELQNTPEIREAVVRRIREVRAETVVSCDPTAVFFESTAGTTTTATYYNHSDHRMAGWVALDSAFPGSGTRTSTASIWVRVSAFKTSTRSGSAGRTTRTEPSISPGTCRRRLTRLRRTRVS